MLQYINNTKPQSKTTAELNQFFSEQKKNTYFEDPLIIAVLGHFHYIVWVCPALYSIP